MSLTHKVSLELGVAHYEGLVFDEQMASQELCEEIGWVVETWDLANLYLIESNVLLAMRMWKSRLKCLLNSSFFSASLLCSWSQQLSNLTADSLSSRVIVGPETFDHCSFWELTKASGYF